MHSSAWCGGPDGMVELAVVIVEIVEIVVANR